MLQIDDREFVRRHVRGNEQVGQASHPQVPSAGLALVVANDLALRSNGTAAERDVGLRPDAD